eukprot:2362077-Rhodomonas_salina.1
MALAKKDEPSRNRKPTYRLLRQDITKSASRSGQPRKNGSSRSSSGAKDDISAVNGGSAAACENWRVEKFTGRACPFVRRLTVSLENSDEVRRKISSSVGEFKLTVHQVDGSGSPGQRQGLKREVTRRESTTLEVGRVRSQAIDSLDCGGILEHVCGTKQESRPAQERRERPVRRSEGRHGFRQHEVRP